MFRLSVGRRLGLVVVCSILAASAVSLFALSVQGDDGESLAVASVDAVASSVDAVISADLQAASQRLEVLALTADDEAGPIAEEAEDAGFVAIEVLALNADSRLNASVNLLALVRATGQTTVGASGSLEGSVIVRIATSLGEDENSTSTDLDLLVGAYDASDLISRVGQLGADSGMKVMLAVRNGSGEIVVIDPSEGDGSYNSPTALEVDTLALIEDAFTDGDAARRTDATIDRVESLATIQRVSGAEWVAVTSLPRDQIGANGPPLWLLPAFMLVAFVSLVPVLLFRRRLDRVVIGAQQLFQDRLLEPLNDDSDDEIGILSRSLQSLDERLHAEAELRSQSAATLQHRASHDPLTGLANRARLVEELTDALGKRDPVALIFCDIDGFKGINDSQGHEAGDIVLKFVASQLASVVPSTDLIARFGGDEFCVLIRAEPQPARDIAAKVERALDATVVVNDTSLRIGGSVGMAVAKVTDTPDSILKSADLAMYREKERRRGLRRSAQEAEGEIELSTDQIRLVYQPVVNIADGSIVGVEVLARYMHPVLGMMDPSTFLPPGTERSEFDNFDLVIMSRSIAQLSDWLSSGIVSEDFTMSFNLVPDHVSDPSSHRLIFDNLRQNRVPPAMLQIEVTEQRLHAHEDDLKNSLHILRSKGIKIAIDDFGIDGSNVDRLVQIPSDTVKIDRSFISEIDVDERAQARLRAILDIVAADGHVAIAEGVERETQADILKELEVPFGQGYLWHAPLSSIALTPLLGRASRWTRRKPPPTPVK